MNQLLVGEYVHINTPILGFYFIASYRGTKETSNTLKYCGSVRQLEREEREEGLKAAIANDSSVDHFLNQMHSWIFCLVPLKYSNYSGNERLKTPLLPMLTVVPRKKKERKKKKPVTRLVPKPQPLLSYSLVSPLFVPFCSIHQLPEKRKLKKGTPPTTYHVARTEITKPRSLPSITIP